MTDKKQRRENGNLALRLAGLGAVQGAVASKEGAKTSEVASNAMFGAIVGGLAAAALICLTSPDKSDPDPDET